MLSRLSVEVRGLLELVDALAALLYLSGPRRGAAVLLHTASTSQGRESCPD